ncbi:MAG: (E)-4-hydroxy-3-methylbut-2-enyl-diphosphate synthase [Chloroflexota bacterium]
MTTSDTIPSQEAIDAIPRDASGRRITREVMVGEVGVGGDNPIRVQSMTTTLTKDIDATVAQVARLVGVGCEIVRITTPTPSDARCLEPIKEKLAQRRVHVPLVADIHFSPAAAMAAADFADKVRVNPGNFVDSRKFAVREYNDEQYEAELQRVAEKFTPLVLKCKERGVAMRIGTNHGSLSDRIMNRFGDTPLGMVESALEFVRVCELNDYHDIILSMKASNPKVMIAAYRMLAFRMAELGMDYPFHLGVTEAGNGQDGRIKSAVGIGSLLEDGIGDTIRVSLTEEPEAEVPVAFALARRYSKNRLRAQTPVPPSTYQRRATTPIDIDGLQIGGGAPVAVIGHLGLGLLPEQEWVAHALRWASPAGRRRPKPDAALIGGLERDGRSATRVRRSVAKWPNSRLPLIGEIWELPAVPSALPELDALLIDVSIQRPDRILDSVMLGLIRESGKPVILQSSRDDYSQGWIDELLAMARKYQQAGIPIALTLLPDDPEYIDSYRRLATRMDREGLEAPLILSGRSEWLPLATTMGSLLCDGLGDAVLLEPTQDAQSAMELAFDLLQATGARISKTDYVACPSCGRTLFDLEETTERIKRRTAHLVGVKIAIMGCIVNGPGEMADADFGYVGGAPGQVNLYVGKQCVEKGVPAEEADGRLIELIKQHGKWEEEEDEEG